MGRHHFAERRDGGVGKGVAELSRHRAALRPRLLRRGPKHGNNAEQLIELVAAGEKRAGRHKLHHDAPRGPHIDWARVGAVLQQQLRPAVPARRHIVRKRWLCSNLLYEAKVRKLHNVKSIRIRWVFFDEHILRLEVAVEVPALVEVGERLEHLVHDGAHLGVGHHRGLRVQRRVRLGRANDAEKVAVHKLKHKEQLVALPKHLLQLDNVRVGVELAEGLHLWEFDAFVPTIVLLLHPLDGDGLAGLFVDSAGDCAVRAVTNLLLNFVLVHYSFVRFLSPFFFFCLFVCL